MSRLAAKSSNAGVRIGPQPTMPYRTFGRGGGQDFSRFLEILDEGRAKSYLQITRNVDTILRRFRSKSEEQHVWIDAVSLDQSDEAEKAQQIPIMGGIYEQAEAVQIWLGPEDEKTEEALSFLRNWRIVDSDDSRDKGSTTDEMRARPDAPSWLDPVYSFCEQPWFSRH
ncbi:hypothetical protein OQA88_3484 [Cercophora sp. LCS_1]